MVQNTEKRARGRPRAYDPERALSLAMDAFWLSGYSGTSLDSLSARMGMNRPSLYSAFGDKRALYLSALDRYTAESADAMREALRFDAPLRDGLANLYRQAISFYVPRKNEARGCFLIGTAAVEAMSDKEIRTKLRQALRRFDGVLEERFRHARTCGELSHRADPAELARMASAVLHTLAIRARAGETRPSLEAIAGTGVRLICAGV
jgi:AcrR family transcriptional regulator